MRRVAHVQIDDGHDALSWAFQRPPHLIITCARYLVESVLPVAHRNFVTGRFELVDKNELLNVPAGTYRIGAYTAGYTRDVDLFTHIQTGIGANFTAYSTPSGNGKNASEASTVPASGNTAFIAPTLTLSTRLICPAPTLTLCPARA